MAEARSLALPNAGNSIPARTAMMAITTRSLMRVKKARQGSFSLKLAEPLVRAEDGGPQRAPLRESPMPAHGSSAGR
jgi:hypothetical protein